MTNKIENNKLSDDELLIANSYATNNNSKFALTTIDNPYNPFTQFYDWFLFDSQKGYNSCAYLARIAQTSNQFSDEENNEEIEKAIDEIIKYDFLKIYKKVENKNYKNEIE